jgi:hypothetical protein
MKISSASRKPSSGRAGASLSSWRNLAPWSTPSGTPPRFTLQKFGRDAALVAGHQVGGNKPLREIRPPSTKHCSRGHRPLPIAGAALVDSQMCPQPPSRPPAAAGHAKPAGQEARPKCLMDRSAVPNRAAKSRSPAIGSPFTDPRYAPKGRDGLQNIWRTVLTG